MTMQREFIRPALALMLTASIKRSKQRTNSHLATARTLFDIGPPRRKSEVAGGGQERGRCPSLKGHTVHGRLGHSCFGICTLMITRLGRPGAFGFKTIVPSADYLSLQYIAYYIHGRRQHYTTVLYYNTVCCKWILDGDAFFRHRALQSFPPAQRVWLVLLWLSLSAGPT